MTRIEKIWQADDGLETFCVGWRPKNCTRAVVCLVHGLGEHSERYAHVAEHLGSASFSLIGADLRGHGRSAGARGHITSPGVYLDHIDRLIDEARREYPDLPIFLYGHSLGGTVVLYYIIKQQPDLSGVVVTSPGLRTALEKQRLKIALAKLLGTLTPQIIMPTGLDAEQISRDPEVVRKYQTDPLVHDKASIGMAKYTLEMIPWIYEHAPEIQLPILIMHGTADKIAFSTGSEEIAARIGKNCTLKLWEGLSHETHNEPEKAQVLDYFIAWLEANI